MSRVAEVVLRNLGGEPWHVADVVRLMLKRGTPSRELDARDLPYTSRAKETLELAMREASELYHSYVGTEHLLLGLLCEEKNIGAQVLNSLGITLESARAETLRVLGVEVTNPSLTPPPGEEPIRGTLALEYANGALVARHFTDLSEAVRFLGTRDV